jgi:hypothetical protein
MGVFSWHDEVGGSQPGCWADRDSVRIRACRVADEFLLYTSAIGWIASILIGPEILLPYFLRRTRLSEWLGIVSRWQALSAAYAAALLGGIRRGCAFDRACVGSDAGGTHEAGGHDRVVVCYLGFAAALVSDGVGAGVAGCEIAATSEIQDLALLDDDGRGVVRGGVCLAECVRPRLPWWNDLMGTDSMDSVASTPRSLKTAATASDVL